MTIMMASCDVADCKRVYRECRRRVPRGSSAVAITQRECLIGIDAPVAQIRPDASHGLAAREVRVGDQYLGTVVRAREHLALRPRDEAVSPKLNALGVARGVGFEADAIARQHGQTVGDGVRTLDGDPRLALTQLFVGVLG